MAAFQVSSSELSREGERIPPQASSYLPISVEMLVPVDGAWMVKDWLASWPDWEKEPLEFCLRKLVSSRDCWGSLSQKGIPSALKFWKVKMRPLLKAFLTRPLGGCKPAVAQ